MFRVLSEEEASKAVRWRAPQLNNGSTKVANTRQVVSSLTQPPHQDIGNLMADADAQQGANDLVVGQHTLGVRNERALRAIAVAGRDLDNLGTIGARCFVHALQQFDLASFGNAVRPVHDRVRSVCRGPCERHRADAATALCRRCRSSRRRGRQPCLAQVRRVCEAGGVASDDANASTSIASTRDLLDSAIIQAGGGGRLVFGVHLRKLSAGAHSSGKDSFEDVCVDHARQDTTRSET